MSINLVVTSQISSPSAGAQVLDANNNQSGLSLGKEAIIIHGKDTVGQTLPLTVVGDTAGQKMGTNTWGRIVRLQNNGTSGKFWDIGIDQAGNLFFNAGEYKAGGDKGRVFTIAYPNQPGNVNES